MLPNTDSRRERRRAEEQFGRAIEARHLMTRPGYGKPIVFHLIRLQLLAIGNLARVAEIGELWRI